MLKETETEEIIDFFVTFFFGVISIEGARTPWAPPLASRLVLQHNCGFEV